MMRLRFADAQTPLIGDQTATAAITFLCGQANTTKRELGGSLGGARTEEGRRQENKTDERDPSTITNKSTFWGTIIHQ